MNYKKKNVFLCLLILVFILLGIRSITAKNEMYDDFGEYDTVFFEKRDAELSSEAKQTLDKQVLWLIKNEDKIVIIEGHTGDGINREGSLLLGEKRAKAVKDYLVSKDIFASRLYTISYGVEKPATDADEEVNCEKNRRVTTIIKEQPTE